MEYLIHIAEDGRIINRGTVRDAFSRLKPGDVLMILKPANKRSIPQNKYYHGVVVPMIFTGLRDVGYNDIELSDVHEILKFRFLRKEIPCENDGPAMIIQGSTAKLSTVEFMEYIARIQAWSAEFLNVVIPDPGTQTSFNFYDDEIKA